MTIVYVCPECGTEVKGAVDDDVCPACLVPLKPVHDHDRHMDPLATPELTGPEKSIDAMMRSNRGVAGM